MNTPSTTTQHDDTNDTCHLNQDRTGMLDLGCTCEWTEQDQHDLGRWTN